MFRLSTAKLLEIKSKKCLKPESLTILKSLHAGRITVSPADQNLRGSLGTDLISDVQNSEIKKMPHFVIYSGAMGDENINKAIENEEIDFIEKGGATNFSDEIRVIALRILNSSHESK